MIHFNLKQKINPQKKRIVKNDFKLNILRVYVRKMAEDDFFFFVSKVKQKKKNNLCGCVKAKASDDRICQMY